MYTAAIPWKVKTGLQGLKWSIHHLTIDISSPHTCVHPKQQKNPLIHAQVFQTEELQFRLYWHHVCHPSAFVRGTGVQEQLIKPSHRSLLQQHHPWYISVETSVHQMLEILRFIRGRFMKRPYITCWVDSRSLTAVSLPSWISRSSVVAFPSHVCFCTSLPFSKVMVVWNHTDCHRKLDFFKEKE